MRRLTSRFRARAPVGDGPEHFLYVGTRRRDGATTMLGLERSFGRGAVRRTARTAQRRRRAVLAGTALMGAAAGGLATGAVAAGGVVAAAVLRRRHRRMSLARAGPANVDR
jgi:hypothetical protein